MVYILGSMAIDTKVSSNNAWNTEKVLKNSLTETYIKEITLMESLPDMDNTIGPTVVILKVSLKMV